MSAMTITVFQALRSAVRAESGCKLICMNARLLYLAVSLAHLRDAEAANNSQNPSCSLTSIYVNRFHCRKRPH